MRSSPQNQCPRPFACQGAGPPRPGPDVDHQRGNQQRADHERVEQDTEGHDERDLHQEGQRDHHQRRERRGEHHTGRGDHSARRGQPAQHPLPGAVRERLLTHPGHQEDVVVDAEGHQEHESVQRDRRVRTTEPEQMLEDEGRDPEGGQEVERDGRDEQHGHEHGTQQ